MEHQDAGVISDNLSDSASKETLHTYVSKGFTVDKAVIETPTLNVKPPLPRREHLWPGWTASQFQTILPRRMPPPLTFVGRTLLHLEGGVSSWRGSDTIFGAHRGECRTAAILHKELEWWGLSK